MFRSFLFWVHLAVGLAAAIFIAVMSVTGIALAFEDELIAWGERDARRVEIPRDFVDPFSPEEMLTTFSNQYPGSRATSLTVFADPHKAYAIAAGREVTYYADPHTGEFRRPASDSMRRFMHTMESWHRWLGRDGDARAFGKTLNDAANVAFVFLALSGLYLWCPRVWRWKVLRRSFLLISAKGKARDWNWHNAIGFWCLLPILVMSVTGVVISYRWAGNLVYSVAGEEPPPPRSRGGPPPAETSPERIAPPRADSSPLPIDGIMDAMKPLAPGWESLRIRLPLTSESADPTVAGASPVAVTAQLPDRWPRTATTTFELDPFTGELIRTQTFADQTRGRRARIWMRFLHTGQALGWVGQLVAALGCLGGLFLVYTGIALSWRRFFQRGKTRDADT